MKRIMSLMLALMLCLGLALPVRAAEPEGFSDLEGHYAREAVETWSGYGVLKGYPDGSFKPNDPVTRAELAVVLDRIMGYQSAAENTFSDVPERAWYAQSILRLTAEGILQGRKAGQMMPKSAVTRQEAFAALARCFGLEISQSAPGFTDDADIAPWAVGYVSAMKEAGYIRGDKKTGAIRPDDPITRAELVTILDRMIPGFVNEDGTYSRDCEGNLVINAQDVHLEDMTIEGNLIVSDGVGEGDVYLEKVTVKGDIILRGCGENSFHILPGCDVKNIIVTKTTGGIIRLVNESGKTIPMIFVNDGKAGVTLDGDALGEVVVACDAPVTIAAKSVKTLSVTGGAKLTVNKGSTVSSLELAGTAKTAQVTVEGKVSRLTNDAGVKVDKQNGGSVGGSSGSGGSSSGGSSSGGSSSGGSGGGSTTTPKTVSEVTLQLLAPAFGNIPDEADALGVGYSARTEWFNADGSAPSYRWKAPDSTEEDTFTADQAYRAVVTLSPVSGYAFGSALKVNVTDGNGNDFTPAKSEKNGNDWVVTLEYEKTEEKGAIENINILGQNYVYASKFGEQEVRLTLNYRDNSLIDPATYTYKWYKSNSYSGNNKTLIVGANTKEYIVSAADIQGLSNVYFFVDIDAGGKTYSSYAKGIEIRSYDPINEDDITQPIFGEKIEFEENTGTIDVSNLTYHPEVLYSFRISGSGPNNDYVVYGKTYTYEESFSSKLLSAESEEGTAKVTYSGSESTWFEWPLREDPTAALDFTIDTVTVHVTPEYEGKSLSDKYTEKIYSLGEDSFYYHIMGAEANVTGEAAEYRPAIDGKLIVDQEKGSIAFVREDGSSGLPEKCTYAQLSLQGDTTRWYGTDDNPNGLFMFGNSYITNWIEKIQDQGVEPTARLCVTTSGIMRHHKYIYFVDIPADRIVFEGGNN